MDFLVERMLDASCTELRVVTRPEKRDVIENAARHGATVIEAYPPSLAASVLAGLRGLADDDVVMFGFPDAIGEPVDSLTRIIPLLDDGWEVVLGLVQAARAEDLPRHEPVLFDESGTVRRIEFKPARPSSTWIWSCAVASARALRGLEGEAEPGVYFDSLCPEGRVGSLLLPGTFLDIGTPARLREAAGRDLS